MAKWKAFPYADKAYVQTAATLKKHWDRLHKGDREQFPKDDKVIEAWIAYHAGDFQKAHDIGMKAGDAGVNVANKAQAIYANYLEKSEPQKLAMFQEVIGRAEALQKSAPKNVNAWYLHAYALGRYSQGISIAKALAQGLGGKVRSSLDHALKLDPKHADAHVALGAYHAEIIGKVGAMLGGLTYGAKQDAGISHYEQAIALNPDSAIARIEYANGLVIMLGKAKLKDAEKLYAEAAKCKPLDSMERLDVEMAKAEIEG
jgi:tetratricopeptide (TPR) repeat protein